MQYVAYVPKQNNGRTFWVVYLLPAVVNLHERYQALVADFQKKRQLPKEFNWLKTPEEAAGAVNLINAKMAEKA